MVHTRGPESKLARRFRAEILREHGGRRITAEEMSRCVAAARAVLGVRADPPSRSVSKPLHMQRRTGAARRQRRRGKRQETTAASSGVGREPTSPASQMEVATVLEEDATVTDEEGGWGNMAPLDALMAPRGAGAARPGQGDSTGRVVTLRTRGTPCRLSLGKGARLREARTQTGQQ